MKKVLRGTQPLIFATLLITVWLIRPSSRALAETIVLPEVTEETSSSTSAKRRRGKAKLPDLKDASVLGANATTSSETKHLAESLKVLSDESEQSAALKLPTRVRKLFKSTFQLKENVQIVIQNTYDENFKVEVSGPGGEVKGVSVTSEKISNQMIATIIADEDMIPGKYVVKVLNEKYGVISEEEFSWGVLAINTNKATYQPNETANIALAVLDEKGNMVCDADLELSITSPSGDQKILSTEDEITVNPECFVKDYTQNPDYETTYRVGSNGFYRMELTARTDNGEYIVDDSFVVDESVLFDIERKSATRIYPPHAYPVEINITATEDFSGYISEPVPSSFSIKPSDSSDIHEYQIITRRTQQDSVLGATDTNLSMPFDGNFQVTGLFGDQLYDPILRAKYHKYGVNGHDGIDFPMPEGTEVKAVDDGRVVLAEINGDYGTTLVIEHSWGKSYYGHLSEFKTKHNTFVKKGDLVALSGNSGLSTAPHLHFGMKFNENDVNNGFYGKIDPSSYLGLAQKEVLGAKSSEDDKEIVWEVDLKKGEKIRLAYQYEAPNISPEFYKIGPLNFYEKDENSSLESAEKIFIEARPWQIAVDATQVIEIQRGVADIGNSGGTQTAPSDFTEFGSMTNAFVLNGNNRYMNSGPTSSTANMSVDDMSGGLALTATDTITYYRDSGSIAANNRFHWESWEYTGSGGGANEFIVRGRFNMSIVTTARTGTDTVTSCTDREKCIPFITGILNSDPSADADNGTALCSMTADNTVTCERGGTVDTTDIYGVVVEFTGSAWSVGHGRTGDVSADTGTIDLFEEADGLSGGNSFSVADWDNAIIFHQFKGDDSAGNEAIADTSATYVPGSTNNTVDWSFNANHDGSDNQHMVHVLENPFMTVNRFSSTGNAQNDNNINITSAGVTDLTNTAIVGSANSSGTGVAYGRGWKGIYLTSTTNASAWAHRSGNTIATQIQVIDLPQSDYLTAQNHYRWRDDSTDLNTTGGWLAAEDSSAIGSITKNTTYRIRMEVANIGDAVEPAARTYELQWGDRVGLSACSGVSTWTGVANGNDEFRMIDTTHISPDGESTTVGLLANTEGFSRVNGEGRDSADTTGSLGALSASTYTELEYAIQATDDAVTGRTYCFRLYDTTADAPLGYYTRYPSARLASSTISGVPTMEWGTQSNVSDDGWTTVNFNNTFSTPVFICTIQYDNNIGSESVNNAAVGSDADSAVCRVQNVGATSAQVRLQEPGASDLQNETIHWLVVEEGIYDTGDIKMEAFSYTSTVTDDNGSYVGQTQSYSQSYTTPVVLGQVMTYNDVDWSVFYARGASQTDPADSSTIITGKHVGEDTDIVRSNETIGVVVIEQDHGSLDAYTYEAWQNTGNNIERIDDSPNDTYTFNTSFSSTPAVGIVSQSGINGADGPHPVLYGSTPLSTTTINPTIQEDEINDDEQSGNTEDVAYVVFSAAGSYSAGQIAFDQTTYRFYENTNNLQPSVALASENTAITGVDDGDVLRIRMALQIGINDLAITTQTFKLQYGQGANCSAIVTWNDLGAAGSGSIWRGYDNATPSDGAQISASLLNSQTNALQSYEEENNSSSNPAEITRGTRGEWDWVVENNGASDSTDYCFRTVLSDDTEFIYTNYPKATTSAGVEIPTLSQLMRHGSWFNSGGVIQPFTF